MTDETRSWTTAEVAQILNCSQATVRRMCRLGQLRYIRLGPGRSDYRILDDPLGAVTAPGDHDPDAQHWVDEARAEGRLPAEANAETLGRIANILRRHYAEQADRTAS